MGAMPHRASALRIAILSKSDSRGGGASRVAELLAAGLRRSGHTAVHFRAQGTGFTATSRPLYGPAPLRQATRLAHAAQRRLGWGETVPFELPAVMLAGLARNFDLVHAHDLSSAISPLTLRWLAARLPTVWTLHDCSPFTGGCLYPMGCTRFRTSCGGDGGCPRLGEWPIDGLLDRTGPIQRIKTALHAQGSLTTLAPSAWMADLAASSGKLRARPQIMANGVDLGVFRPAANRAALRRWLGLPAERRIVLVSAGFLHDTRKGIPQALAALREVADLKPFVLVVGEAERHLPQALGGLAHHATGYLTDPARLADCYAAADLFLFCTLADNQPLAVLETMACATPVVGFATGGIPELVDQGQNGWLVSPDQPAALAAGLRRALAPDVAEAWGRAARVRVEAEFGLERCIARHVALYRSLLDRQQRRSPSPEPGPDQVASGRFP